MVLLFSNLKLSSMNLQGREGAYVTLGVKVMGYLPKIKPIQVIVR